MALSDLLKSRGPGAPPQTPDTGRGISNSPDLNCDFTKIVKHMCGSEKCLEILPHPVGVLHAARASHKPYHANMYVSYLVILDDFQYVLAIRPFKGPPIGPVYFALNWPPNSNLANLAHDIPVKYLMHTNIFHA